MAWRFVAEATIDKQMPAPEHIARQIISRLTSDRDPRELLARLEPRSPSEHPLPRRLPRPNDTTPAAAEERREALSRLGISTDTLGSAFPAPDEAEYEGHIEGLIGFAGLPVGVLGPLRINGLHAQGDYFVPLATSEGALVASCNRGACVISRAGGASVACLTECVSRAPCFMFPNLREAGAFLVWVLEQRERLQPVVDGTSRHCRLLDIMPTMTGKEVFLILEYTTGDAAGQNMVTLATDAVCRWLVEQAPVKPLHWYVEGNLSGDKKATMLSFLFARGKKVVAEAVIEAALLRRYLGTTAEDMTRYWQISVLGGTQSGSIGVQGHYANALAALFIACGQDAACVAEASVGLTRMDLAEDNGLYVSVSLPNLIVGTVGGGTDLPTARECLAMLGCRGDGTARKFAEICAATALAGEISIIAALAAGDFARAHATYGRRRVSRC